MTRPSLRGAAAPLRWAPYPAPTRYQEPVARPFFADARASAGGRDNGERTQGLRRPAFRFLQPVVLLVGEQNCRAEWRRAALRRPRNGDRAGVGGAPSAGAGAAVGPAGAA